MPLHLDSGLGDAEQLSCLMLGQNAGDVVVDYNHLIDFAKPLLGEHPDGGRAAAHPHAFFLRAINHRWLARLHDHCGAFINRKFHRLAIAQVQQGLTSDRTFATAAAGEMADATQREHL